MKKGELKSSPLGFDMGLFSSKKKTYVSSVIYNMAGDDEENRPQILKSLVIGSMIGNRRQNMTQTLQQGYLHGNGMKLRQFYNWSTSHYPAVGIPKELIYGNREISIPGVEAAISQTTGSKTRVEWIESGAPDITYWAMKWVYENMPERMEDEWSFDADENGDGSYTGVINFADGVTVPVVLNVLDYEQFRLYIFARYQSDTGMVSGPTVTGPVDNIGSNPFPSTTGWSAFSSSTSRATKRLERYVLSTASFSDGRPNEVSNAATYSTEAYDSYRGVFTRRTNQGLDPSGSHKLKQEFMIQVQDRAISTVRSYATRTENLPGGVVKTINDVIDQDTLVIDRSVQINAQEVTLNSWGSPRIFIYKWGSGHPKLDAMLSGVDTNRGYFPMIPLRLNNQFVSETYKPALYDQSVKALKKSTGADYDEIIDKLKENESLGEIDFAYVVFGVPLNTKENACRKYLYDYFASMARTQRTVSGDTSAWQDQVYGNYTDQKNAWDLWNVEQQQIHEDGGADAPIGGGGSYTEPPGGTYTPPPVTNAKIQTTDKDINFHMEIDWQSITEAKGTGLAKPDAKQNEVWIEYTGSSVYPWAEKLFDNVEVLKTDDIRITWQTSLTTWKSLTIKGLVHKNYIWNGKYVEIGAQEAMEDEDESGFIIPMRADVFRGLSLVDATQMTTSCTYLVLNCYQIVKKKWYERGFFKVILVIVAVVITVLTGGVTAGSIGLLGTYGGVGAALGFTGMAAVIAGAIANMVAAMIVTQLITYASVQILGDELGLIIGTIASMVTLQAGAMIRAGESLATVWSQFMRVDNLLMLSSMVGNNAAQIIMGKAQEWTQKSQKLLEDYAEQSKELTERYAAEFGYGSNIFDPMALTETTAYFNESEAAFLSRTLMTGSEIAELSMDMVTNFSDLTLDVDILR